MLFNSNSARLQEKKKKKKMAIFKTVGGGGSLIKLIFKSTILPKRKGPHVVYLRVLHTS